MAQLFKYVSVVVSQHVSLDGSVDKCNYSFGIPFCQYHRMRLWAFPGERSLVNTHQRKHIYNAYILWSRTKQLSLLTESMILHLHLVVCAGCYWPTEVGCSAAMPLHGRHRSAWRRSFAFLSAEISCLGSPDARRQQSGLQFIALCAGNKLCALAAHMQPQGYVLILSGTRLTNISSTRG